MTSTCTTTVYDLSGISKHRVFPDDLGSREVPLPFVMVSYPTIGMKTALFAT